MLTCPYCELKGEKKYKKMKIIKLPSYSEDEIKEIEKEFDTEDGWVKAGDVFRTVESVFIPQ